MSELNDEQKSPSQLSSILLVFIHQVPLLSHATTVAQDATELYAMSKDNLELLIPLPVHLKC